MKYKVTMMDKTQRTKVFEAPSRGDAEKQAYNDDLSTWAIDGAGTSAIIRKVEEVKETPSA